MFAGVTLHSLCWEPRILQSCVRQELTLALSTPQGALSEVDRRIEGEKEAKGISNVRVKKMIERYQEKLNERERKE